MNPKRAGMFALYTFGSVRYGQLVVPAGVTAYILGAPAWAVISTVVFLALAVVAELFSSVVHAVNSIQEHDMLNQVYSDIERYANGGRQADEEADEEGGSTVG